MPPDENIQTPQRAKAAPYPSTTSHYGLRGKQYRYSHTKPPVVAPPPRNTTRPTVPASAARKKKGQNLGMSTSESQEFEHAPGDGNGSEPLCEQTDLDAMANGKENGAVSGCSTLMSIPEEQNSNDKQQRSSDLVEMDSEMPSNETVLNAPNVVPQMTPDRYPDIHIVQPTPTRAGVQVGNWGTHSPAVLGRTTSVSSSSPPAFRVHNPPPWLLNFDDPDILNPSFQPNPTLPLSFQPAAPGTSTAGLFAQSAEASPGLETNASQLFVSHSSAHHVTATHSLGAPSQTQDAPIATSTYNASIPATNPLNNFLSVPVDNNQSRSISPASSEVAYHAHSAPTTAHPTSRLTPPQARTSDLAMLHASVVQFLGPEHPSVPTQSVPNGYAPVPPPWSASHTLAPSTNPQGYAPAPPPWAGGHAFAPSTNSQSGSRGPSPFVANSRGPSPVPIPSGPYPVAASRGASSVAPSRSTTPAVGPTHGPSHSHVTGARALPRWHFGAGQYRFIKAMTAYWQWYILTKHPFEVNTTIAAEECIAYAEGALHTSRYTVNIGMMEWEYVRIKDSRIRNDSQRGVLGLVESKYNITKDSKTLIEELIRYDNFIYVSYDPLNLRKISGRFRHPCIAEVIRMILFPAVTRGMAPGARFMRELIAMTPQETLQEYEDKSANYGAPIQVIAWACTLILYSLHLLQKGFSSKDPKTKRAPGLDEITYLPHYRKYIHKLKGYNRLGLLRRDHMKPLLEEFTKLQKNGVTGASVEEEDFERFSDEE